MNTTISESGRAASTAALLWPRLAAMLLGGFILAFAGFSQMSVAHNAGHDYRHSAAFPCH